MRIVPWLPKKRAFTFGVVFILACGCVAAPAWADNVSDAMTLLVEGNFAEGNATAIGKLADSGNERAEAVLSALLAGDLYYDKTHRRVGFLPSRLGMFTMSKMPLPAIPMSRSRKRKLKKDRHQQQPQVIP